MCMLALLHSRVDMIAFDFNKLQEVYDVSGWKHAMERGEDNYHNSALRVVGLKSNLPHATSTPYIHDSDSSSDSP